MAEYPDSDILTGTQPGDFRPDTIVHIAGCGIDETVVGRMTAREKVIIVPEGAEFDATLLNDNDAIISILRPAHIVGTGMDGIPRQIVNGIARGTYFHVQGNEARISVVHALDVARLARIVAPVGGEYRFSDNSNPTVIELAEALSVRVNHKRIPTLSPKWARTASRFGGWLGGVTGNLLATLTSDNTVSNPTDLSSLKDFEPRNVVDYLSTHKYDENDI
ncbi:MAG: hypothetical protein K2L30_11470 [Duncaniella sp.]|nr:hypothetical protein [Duncaniella sp.]